MNSVHPDLFRAMQHVDMESLAQLSLHQIRPVLPCLVRMSLITPLDLSRECALARKTVFKILSGIELVNSIVGLLSIDFHALEIDVRKEQQLRQKIGSQAEDSVLIQSLPQGIALEFERSDATRRLRLLLSELLFLMAQVRDAKLANADFTMKVSDLLDQSVYLEEVCDALCVVLAELPALLSVAEVAEALLRVSCGPWLIGRVVANMPDTFTEICSYLIANGEPCDGDTLGCRIRVETLRMLARMSPAQMTAIRALCVEQCKLPALTILLTLDKDQQDHDSPDSAADRDLVPFISGLLLGADPAVKHWFAGYIKNVQKKHDTNSGLHKLREELLIRLQVLVRCSSEAPLPDGEAVEAAALLRLYCALKGIANLKFFDEEGHLLLQLITSRPSLTTAGCRLVSLSLCTLLACPSLLASTEQEQRSVHWIRWLIKEEAFLQSTGGMNSTSTSCGELLLLLALHFHSNQLNAVCDLVSSTLGMKLAIRPHSVARMKQVFTQEIFTEQVVASLAVKVPVTTGLNAEMSGYLPVHCIYQLLKSRSFTKHKVPIKAWIYKQICESRPPLHPLLPSLVDAYVNSMLSLNPKGGALPTVIEHTNEPLSEQEIRAVFQNTWSSSENQASNDSSITAQLLLLYYLMLYEDIRLTNWKTYLIAGIGVKVYPPQLLSQLPIRYLLGQAEKDQQLYAGLFSPLLRFLTTHMPQLCLVEDWMYEEAQACDVISLPAPNLPCDEANLAQVLKNVAEFPLPAMLLLRRLLVLPQKQLWALGQVFVQHIRYILDAKVPRQVQELYKQVWLRLNRILPRSLWVMTVNALRPSSFHSFKIISHLLTQEDILVDPLHVLRCDTNVFRCAPILHIVLHMLKALMAASRAYLARHLMEKPVLPGSSGLPGQNANMASDTDREELRAALVATQESAVVQLVLEICLPTKEDAEFPSQLSDLKEVQSVVCSFLHQLYIADPNLAKLVHFQGYPSSLLSITVKGIPSMHICLDFLPELLAQPELEKQLFAVDLASHLSLQYALPKSMGVARLAINVLYTLLSVLPSNGRSDLFLPALPALVRIATAFPPLVEDIMVLLALLGKVARSQACLQEAVHYVPNSSKSEWGDSSQAEDETTVEEAAEVKMEVDPDSSASDVRIKKEPEEGEEEGELLETQKTLHVDASEVSELRKLAKTDKWLETAEMRNLLKEMPAGNRLCEAVKQAFQEMIDAGVLKREIY
nr:EOG090X0154 [Triops cancriformis]